MNAKHLIIAASLSGLILALSSPAQQIPVPDGTAYRGKELVAKTYNSNFPEGHDTYNGMGAASDDRIYYVLSSENIDVGARMFCFDPHTKIVEQVGELTEACGENGLKTIPQGKSHVNFIEANGKLYFSTHVGVYSIVDGMEKMGIPPAGYKEYPGGHLLSYDLKTRKYEDFGIVPDHEGVLTTSMDTRRGRIFGITWPSGMFFRYDLATRAWKNFGKTCAEGENGKAATYRTVCRSIAVDLNDGSAYLTTSEGTILRYNAATDSIVPIAGEDMKKDYFGLYDPTSPGHMGYNWRQTFWRAADRMIYGVHGNSGYLFRFDPAVPRIEVLDRITSESGKRTGMFDQFSYGYLGFAPTWDCNTICYLTGAPIYADGKRITGKSSTAMGEAKGLEDLHLITWHIPTGKYTDHGAIFYENGERPLYVNSIAVGRDGTVYSLGRTKRGGKVVSDLFAVRPR